MPRKKKAANAVSEQAVSKAPLSEIFAAMTGIMCAGIEARNGNTGDLEELGLQAAERTYRMKEILFSGDPSSTAHADRMARVGLAFLQSSLSTLKRYPDAILANAPRGKKRKDGTPPPAGKQESCEVTQALGGTVSEVIAHIHDILAREALPVPRPLEKMTHTKPLPQFRAPYLPGGKDHESRSYVYTPKEDEETPEDEFEDEGGEYEMAEAPKSTAKARQFNFA